MSQFSFSSGHQVSWPDAIDHNPNRVDPHDPSCKFNRVVYSRPGKPLSDIYSIDTLKILQAIDQDKLDDLYRITLLGRQVMYDQIASGGTGMWDTLFNSAQQKALTGCIFMAGNDYKPLPLSRMAMSSQFLNFSMPVSRIQKNQVHPGDRVGIGIHDLKEQLYYILLYRVDDLCQVTIDVGVGRRPFLQPAVNLTMEQACRVEYNGNASIVDMEEGLEYDEEKAGPFVSYVIRAIANITEAYPFRAHYTPLPLNRVDHVKLSERLVEEVEEAKPTTWEDFKQICKEAYETARRSGSNSVPALEVVTFTESDKIVCKLESQYNEDNVSYSFSKDDLDKDRLTEIYLTNQDLIGQDLDDIDSVTKLGSTDTMGERLVRYFGVNY